VAALLLAALPRAAVYAASPGQGQLLLTTIIPLHADCTHVPNTKVAHEQLATYHLCGYGASVGVITPDSTVTGDCGSLSLNVFDSKNGILQWKAEIYSIAGPFVSASYSGDWLNRDNGRSADVVRSTGVTFTDDWLDIFPISTGPGWVWAKITAAQSTLWYGVICYNNGPVASGATVT